MDPHSWEESLGSRELKKRGLGSGSDLLADEGGWMVEAVKSESERRDRGHSAYVVHAVSSRRTPPASG